MKKVMQRILRLLSTISLLYVVIAETAKNPFLWCIIITLMVFILVNFEFPYRFVAWIFLKLGRLNYVCITLPFQNRYITVRRKSYAKAVSLPMIQHETDHILYFADRGAVTGTVIYLAYLIWYGYRDNPVEVRARRAAGQDE